MSSHPEVSHDVFVLEDSGPRSEGALAVDLARARGELHAYRHAVRQTLEVRFGGIPETIARRIESEPEVGQLIAWHAQAVAVRRLKHFRL